MDVHKKVCRAAIMNDEGELVDEFSFRNSSRGIEDFMMRIEAFRDGVLVAVESTANLWIRLYDSLEERGVQVVLVDKVRGLRKVTVYTLYSILSQVLTREAAENIGRPEKAVSPTYFNT